MSDRCPIHPMDRKPFRADPRLVANALDVISQRNCPYFDNGGYSIQDHAKRMVGVDCVMAVCQAMDVVFVLEVEPNGRYVMKPN